MVLDSLGVGLGREEVCSAWEWGAEGRVGQSVLVYGLAGWPGGWVGVEAATGGKRECRKGGRSGGSGEGGCRPLYLWLR